MKMKIGIFFLFILLSLKVVWCNKAPNNTALSVTTNNEDVVFLGIIVGLMGIVIILFFLCDKCYGYWDRFRERGRENNEDSN